MYRLNTYPCVVVFFFSLSFGILQKLQIIELFSSLGTQIQPQTKAPIFFDETRWIKWTYREQKASCIWCKDSIALPSLPSVHHIISTVSLSCCLYPSGEAERRQHAALFGVLDRQLWPEAQLPSHLPDWEMQPALWVPGALSSYTFSNHDYTAATITTSSFYDFTDPQGSTVLLPFRAWAAVKNVSAVVIEVILTSWYLVMTHQVRAFF